MIQVAVKSCHTRLLVKTSVFCCVLYHVPQMIVWTRLLSRSVNLSGKSLSDGKDFIGIKMYMKTLTRRRDVTTDNVITDNVITLNKVA